MNRFSPLAIRLIAAGLLLAAGYPPAWAAQPDKRNPPSRIVSLAPSITETLFALGVGSRVVGVTQHCIYPEEARKLPRVGGYYDPSLESMLRLRPDLVILPPEIYETGKQLSGLQVPVMIVNQRSMAGVISAFVQLGQVCGCEARGSRLAADFWHTYQSSQRPPATGNRPRVLLVLSRDYGVRQLREAYVAGRGELYDELLEMAGGRNAYAKALPKYPKLSAEGVLALDPDVIIELVHSATLDNPEALRRDWQSVPGLRAAARNRIVIMTGEYLTVPGPRLLSVLEQLRVAIHEAEKP